MFTVIGYYGMLSAVATPVVILFFHACEKANRRCSG
jgi:hypothetical protein